MYSLSFIKLGDIFDSLVFNVLSKKTDDFISSLNEKLTAIQSGCAEDRRWSPKLEALDAELIVDECRDIFERIEKKKSEINPLAGAASLIGYSSNLLDARHEEIGKSYSTPNELASRNSQCFIDTLVLYFSNKASIDRVYKKYLTTDDFGQIKYEKSLNKISEFVSSKMTGDYGIVPVTDCNKFVFHMCVISALTEKTGNYANDAQKNEIGRIFERDCYQILESNGYKVKETPITGDFGADLIASKNSLSFAIQCKDHKTAIGVSAIQEAHSAKEFYEADFAVVVTKSTFTSAALKMALKLNVMCLSPDDLPSLIQRATEY